MRLSATTSLAVLCLSLGACAHQSGNENRSKSSQPSAFDEEDRYAQQQQEEERRCQEQARRQVVSDCDARALNRQTRSVNDSLNSATQPLSRPNTLPPSPLF